MKNTQHIFSMILIIVLLAVIPAQASTTVWAINDAAQLVSRSYGAMDWIGRISYGQSFELLETKGDYVKLRNDKGNTGWTARENIAYYDPCDMNETMYVQCSGDILWPQADFEDDSITLKKGDALTVVGTTPWKVWYRVEYNGKFYYAPCQLLAEKPAPEEGRLYTVEQRYIIGSGVEIYSTPDETIDHFTYVEDGSVVRLLDASTIDTSNSVGAMVKIQTADGTTGYIHMVNLIPISLD